MVFSSSATEPIKFKENIGIHMDYTLSLYASITAKLPIFICP